MAKDTTDLALADERDLVTLRRTLQARTTEMGFSELARTKLMTAASELGRNILEHAQSGRVTIEEVRQGMKRGISVRFIDKGPGIPDIDLAMTNGFTTKRQSLGLGLGGSRRLVDAMVITSTPAGTELQVTQWLRR